MGGEGQPAEFSTMPSGPLALPLEPVAQGILNETLTGLANAGMQVGSNFTVTRAGTDGDGNTRVSIRVAVGPDGHPLPPIGDRRGEDPAVAILQIEATATLKHAHLISVATKKIYRTKSAWTISGAFKGMVKDGRFTLPGDRVVGPAAGAVIAVLVIAGFGVVVVFNNPNGQTASVATAPATAAQSAAAATTPGGPAPGTVSTDPADLAKATLPVGGLPWAAFKTQEITPAPINPLPMRHRWYGEFAISGGCSGDACTYTTPMGVGATIVIGTLPEVPWEHKDGVWYLPSIADVQSSNTGGLVCVYHRGQSWDFTPTEATWDGGRWLMSSGTGNMFFEQFLDRDQSAAAISAGYCPPWSESSGWTAFVAAETSRLPTTAP